MTITLAITDAATREICSAVAFVAFLGFIFALNYLCD